VLVVGACADDTEPAPPPDPELICTPGATQACYEGPEGTEDVGVCAGGVQTCLGHGRGFGPCEGQVLPTPEQCDAPADENCDALVTCGETVWSKMFGGVDNETVFNLVSDTAGAIYFTGFYAQPIDLGGGPLPSASSQRTILLAKLDGEGNHVWSTAITGAESQQPRNLAVSPAGDAVVVVGDVVADIQLGGQTVSGSGGTDALIAKYDGAGALAWVVRAGDDDNQRANAAAIDADGAVIAAGIHLGVIDLGGEELSTGGFGFDAYVVKLDAAGNHVWSQTYPAPLDQVPRAMGVDAAGRSYIAGRFAGSVDFGGGVHVATSQAADLFLLALEPDGSYAWSKSWGGDGAEELNAIAVDADGNMALVGRFEQDVRFGGTLLRSSGAGTAFVVKLDATGELEWAVQLGGSSEQAATGVAIDAAGRIVVTGYYEGDVTIGETHLPPTGVREPNIFVAKLDADGGVVWARGVTVSGDQDVGAVERARRSVAILPGDGIAFGAYALNTLDLGTGPLTSQGGADILLGVLQP
jgi:hypothetical protein